MDWLSILRRGAVLIASSLVVLLLFLLLGRYATKNRKDTSIVKPSKLYAIIGIIVIIEIGIMVYFSVVQNKIYLLIPFVPISLLGLWLILYGFCWEIKIMENGIEYKNIFNIKHTYFYSEITGIVDKRFGYGILIGKKKIGVDIYSANSSELRTRIAKECGFSQFNQRVIAKPSRRERIKHRNKKEMKNDWRHSTHNNQIDKKSQ